MPYEFVSKWKQEQRRRDTERVVEQTKMINIG
jgi:hypothetical protein